MLVVCVCVCVHVCVYHPIHTIQCPVNDLLENAKSKGIYQTMNTSAFITIEVTSQYCMELSAHNTLPANRCVTQAESVNDGEFLIVLVSTDYSICYSGPPEDTSSREW